MAFEPFGPTTFRPEKSQIGRVLTLLHLSSKPLIQREKEFEDWASGAAFIQQQDEIDSLTTNLP